MQRILSRKLEYELYTSFKLSDKNVVNNYRNNLSMKFDKFSLVSNLKKSSILIDLMIIVVMTNHQYD